LCTNQEATAEKNAQILLMKPVYQHAKNVIAWIGLEERGSEIIFDFADQLQPTGPKSLTDISLPLGMELSSLLQREYWSRVWIIQEIALARKVTIHCGRREMD
jgi:hypothetical protein